MVIEIFMVLSLFKRASKALRVKNGMDDLVHIVKLPFIKGSTNKIAHILKKHKVLATFNPLNTIRSSLRSIKDLVNRKDMKGVYSIPCSCGIPYIGEMGRSINIRIHEHAADLGHRHYHS